MKQKSFFSNGEVTTSLKKLPAYVLDFISAGVIHIFLFAVLEGIINITPFMKDMKDTMSSTYDNLVTCVSDTHISEKDEQGNLVDQNKLIDDYIHGIVLDSLQKNDYGEISEDTYKDYEPINETNDNAFRYYVDFKTNHKEEFIDSSTNTNYGLDYYLNLFFNSVKDENNNSVIKDYFIDNTTSYPYLTFDTAKKIDNYFRDSTYAVGKEICENITEAYTITLSEGIGDVQSKYYPYHILQKQYQDETNKMFIIKLIELGATYLFAILIVYLMMPLIFKDGRTLCMKILKLGATDRFGNTILLGRNLLKTGITLIEFIVLIPVTSFIFYGINGIEIAAYPLIGSISFLSLGAFSLFFMLLSYILSFLLRSTRQTIPEYLSGEIIKDSDVFYIETTLEEEQNESGTKDSHK